MKIARKRRREQRQLTDKKLKPWLPLRAQRNPPVGWLKTTREALGLSARQLAKRLATDPGGVVRLEQREAKGTATLDAVQKAARAMSCRLVYAIVPDDAFDSLEAIVDRRANALARKIARDVSHTMGLEGQSISNEDAEPQLEQLTRELKQALDPRLWDEP